MKRKRMLSLLLAVGLLLSLSACGSGGGAPDAPTAQAQNAAPSAPESSSPAPETTALPSSTDY